MSLSKSMVLIAAAAWMIPATAQAGSFTLTNSTFGIFDASSGTRSVTVLDTQTGFDTGILTGLTVSITYVKADGQGDTPSGSGTPFYNEIHFRVDRAANPSTTLIAAGTYDDGDAGDVFNGTQTFQTGAPLITAGSEPVAGTFSPTGPGSLAAYNGASVLGDWTLFIQDTVGQDALRFHSVSFNFTTEDSASAAVPEPATFALLGTGALAVLRRRRRDA
jgi:hypothetical protein